MQNKMPCNEFCGIYRKACGWKWESNNELCMAIIMHTNTVNVMPLPCSFCLSGFSLITDMVVMDIDSDAVESTQLCTKMIHCFT